jgi:hypothetical protein
VTRPYRGRNSGGKKTYLAYALLRTWRILADSYNLAMAKANPDDALVLEELVCPLTPDHKYDHTESVPQYVAESEGTFKCDRDYHFYCFFEVAPEAVPVGKSAFPVPVEDGYHFFTDDELRQALARQLQLVARDPTNYEGDTRGVICAVSMELNFRQKWAPRFRGFPTPSKQPKTEQERNYLVDLQVLDLHWRACSDRKPRDTVAGYPGIFDPKDWGVGAAVRFAERNLPFNNKTVDARLTPSMMIEHAALQTQDLRDCWRVLRNGYVKGTVVEKWGVPQLEARLTEAMKSSPHLQRHVPGLVNTWVAYKLVGGRKPTEIARLVGLMTGEPPKDRSAITRKLEAIEGRTGWTLD